MLLFLKYTYALHVMPNGGSEIIHMILTKTLPIHFSKYCIMYFNICLMKVPKKVSEPSHSAELVDQMERQWCLRVYPFALTLQETNLKVFVVLRKGTRTKCRYFIELLHDDPAKNFMQCTESNFDTVDAGYGWHSFMERKRLLADPGFYPNSVLRFRFGVQPIDP